MNPSEEQNQTDNNALIEGELSEEELMQIAGGLVSVGVTTSGPVNMSLGVNI